MCWQVTRYEKESVDQTPWIPIVDSSGETRRIVKDTPLAEGEACESDPQFRIFKYQLERPPLRNVEQPPQLSSPPPQKP